MQQRHGYTTHGEKLRVNGKIESDNWLLTGLVPVKPWRERLKDIIEYVRTRTDRCWINLEGCPHTHRRRGHPLYRDALDWQRAIDEGYLQRHRTTTAKTVVEDVRRWRSMRLTKEASYVTYTGKKV